MACLLSLAGRIFQGRRLKSWISRGDRSAHDHGSWAILAPSRPDGSYNSLLCIRYSIVHIPVDRTEIDSTHMLRGEQLEGAGCTSSDPQQMAGTCQKPMRSDTANIHITPCRALRMHGESAWPTSQKQFEPSDLRYQSFTRCLP